MKKAMHAKPFRLRAPGHKARHARPESPRTRVVRAVSLCLACICLLGTFYGIHQQYRHGGYILPHHL